MNAFMQPFALREQRRCRACRLLVEVILLNGASAPRDPYYTCSDCLSAPEATESRLAALTDREQRPQLRLVSEEDDHG